MGGKNKFIVYSLTFMVARSGSTNPSATKFEAALRNYKP